jgi:hypothetical protein
VFESKILYTPLCATWLLTANSSRGDYMSNKKAQGLTLNTIIVAALVLIVLVVLILVFTGQMQEWLRKLRGENDCPGVVIRFDQPCTDETAQPARRNYDVCMKQYTDVDEGYKCCVPAGTEC